ncbi:MAG: hypothetical protein EPN45_01635 [Rhizobiaceae bacterium]|nr:MAG: hypothetical protein EPN45_01635 [Rhizobiaceae bacterium]
MDKGSRFDGVGTSVLRITLLFGTVTIAMALLAVPMLERRTQLARNDGIGLDMTSTGSISRSHIYTVERSVLQAPGRSCIIHQDGTREGDC